METQSPDFESIKQISPYQAEYWSARDLFPLLGYDKWQNFEVAIQRAMTICTLTQLEVSEHFSVKSKIASLCPPFFGICKRRKSKHAGARTDTIHQKTI